ncbi:retinaldehyde-binding protein 1-like [Culicoides brevitarsis]|uniref:retinaldehyde-binding protein 1-like n=1 Tax=Culicoides brevitarsis TaxID=469753 RepID=UPI00307C984A
MHKSLTTIDNYEFLLSNELRKFSEDELRETEDRRTQAIKALREWIMSNSRIDLARMDAKFLLRFLRAKKFNVAMAQDNLERFILLRNAREGMVFHDLDHLLPRMVELLDLGHIFVLPGRDDFNRRIIFYRPGVFDPSKYINLDMIKIFGICYETLMEDEENQIRGFVHVVDCAGLGLKHMTLFTPKEAVRIVKNGERIIPMRHKTVIAFNLSPSIKFAVDFGMALISEKMRKRINIYKDIDECDKIARDLLPAEYGGKIPMKQMIESWKNELAVKRDLILLHDKMQVKLDLYTEGEREGALSALKKPLGFNDESTNSMYGTQGSFRKLEVD